MVDRKARDEMANALEKYLNDEIMAFEFDDALEDIARETQDETIEYARLALWGFYDDLEDRKIVASKEGWDCLQRLLLMLRSDVEYVTTKGRRWTLRNGIAITCLFLIAGRAAWLGFEYPAVLAIALGIISMALTFSRRLTEPAQTSREAATVPFTSVLELMVVRKSVPNFRKKRYPVHIQGRRGQSLFFIYVMSAIALPIYALLWLVLSPVVLLFQAIPENESDYRLILPEPAP